MYNDIIYPYLKISIANLGQRTIMPFSILLSDKDLVQIGFSYDKKYFTRAYLWIKVIKALDNNLIERAEAIKSLLDPKGFKTEVLDKLPKNEKIFPVIIHNK